MFIMPTPAIIVSDDMALTVEPSDISATEVLWTARVMTQDDYGVNVVFLETSRIHAPIALGIGQSGALFALAELVFALLSDVDTLSSGVGSDWETNQTAAELSARNKIDLQTTAMELAMRF